MTEPPSSVGVVIITHNARQLLGRSLPPVQASSCVSRVLVVNSSSGDGTVELAREMGAEVLVVPRGEFNHGATRELARRHLGTDIVVMMTPDAIPADDETIDRLVAPLLADPSVDVSYARQLPHEGSGVLESFSRAFNYPAESEVRSERDVPRRGAFTYFCSNACAAYRSSALDAIGGFRPILTNEDYFAVARILQAGGRIAYVAAAQVRHSHRYSFLQEFRRNVDTGLVRAWHHDVSRHVGRVERHGIAYLRGLLGAVVSETPLQLPGACLHLAAKWLGYRVGLAAGGLPDKFLRVMSAQDYYWTSSFVSVRGPTGGRGS